MSTKKKAFRVLELLLTALVIAALIWVYILVSSDAVAVLKMGEQGRFEDAKEYLRADNWRGALVVFFLQVLQTLIAFVPPELLQVVVGFSFPFYFAVPLMLGGALVGASLIFLFVKQLKWHLTMLEKKTHRVQKAEGRMSHKNATMAAMCLWFAMPLIPFGAVAYYGANKQISFKRYILTCAIGMFPSILLSHFFGSFIYLTLGSLEGKTTLLLSAALAVFLSILLLAFGGWIKHEFYDEHAMERPNPFLYHLVVPFVTLFASLFVRINRRNCERPGKGRPILILGSHTCFFDFYFAAKAMYPRRMTFVVNRFYFEAHIVRFLMRHLGCIPKRLFSPDLETAKKLMAAKREGFLQRIEHHFCMLEEIERTKGQLRFPQRIAVAAAAGGCSAGSAAGLNPVQLIKGCQRTAGCFGRLFRGFGKRILPLRRAKQRLGQLA